jgi:hypothetical protein
MNSTSVTRDVSVNFRSTGTNVCQGRAEEKKAISSTS